MMKSMANDDQRKIFLINKIINLSDLDRFISELVDFLDTDEDKTIDSYIKKIKGDK